MKLMPGFTLILAGVITAALYAALVAMPVYAAKPSFDCAKAGSEVEALICKNDELATLDHKMAEVYKTALNNAPENERNTLKAMQRGWIKGRDDCWKADDIEECVRFNYESRITELQIQYGQLMVPEPVYFRCGESNSLEDTVIAVFYQDSQLPAAVLTRGDDQVIALLSPSASGSKYEGRNVNFWEKGGEALVTWMGEDLRCQAK